LGQVDSTGRAQILQEGQGAIDRDQTDRWAELAGALPHLFRAQPIVCLKQATDNGLARPSEPVAAPADQIEGFIEHPVALLKNRFNRQG
jgi:hypothetical protein